MTPFLSSLVLTLCVLINKALLVKKLTAAISVRLANIAVTTLAPKCLPKLLKAENADTKNNPTILKAVNNSDHIQAVLILDSFFNNLVMVTSFPYSFELFVLMVYDHNNGR